MKRTPEEIRALFDRWSANYDAFALTDGGPLMGYAESLSEAAAMLPLTEGDCLLVPAGYYLRITRGDP